MSINKSLLLLLFLILLISPTIVFADFGSCTGDGCTFPNPLNPSGDPKDDPSPATLMGRVINAVLGIVGSIALVMFIYGGFSWMTAAGNQESVTKGRNILIWATVGLIVIFSAYALVKFVFTAIGG